MQEASGPSNASKPPPPQQQRPRRRRAPFEASRIGGGTGQIRPTSSGRNSPSSSAMTANATNAIARRRQSRLFSARIFSASKARSPFSPNGEDDEETGDAEKPGTSQQNQPTEEMGNQQFFRSKPFSMTGMGRTGAAHLAQTTTAGEVTMENEGNGEMVEEMNEIDEIIEDEPRTIDELSDIEDIELGGDFDFALDDENAPGPSNSTGASLQIGGRKRVGRAKTAQERRRHQQNALRMAQNASLDEGLSIDLAQPRLPHPRRFQRRRPQKSLEGKFDGGGKDLARMEEGKLEGGGNGGGGGGWELRPPDAEERAFSPALDVQLAPSAEGSMSESDRKESRGSVKSIVAAVLSPRRGSMNQEQRRTSFQGAMAVENVPSNVTDEEIRKKSSTQNGSIGGGIVPSIGLSMAHPVPSPPMITISSPTEQKPPKMPPAVGSSDSEAAASTTAGAAAGGIQPSLIKGLSKSISRFRGRNRVLNAEALEQANFMSKFGMSSGTGVQQGGPIGFPEETAGPNAGAKGRLANFIFDTNENYFYHWIAIVSMAYVYNLLVVIARSVFVDLAAGRLWMLWLAIDLLMDSIYATDMFIRSRTGYLEQGLLVRDCAKIRALYLRSRQFLWDAASVLPLDHLCWLISRQPQPILRLNRLLRKDRIQRFMEQTETRTSMPNAFRVGVVVWYIAVIIHWNACFYFSISEWIGLGSDPWVYGVQNKQSLPEGINDTLTRRYIYSFYWSTLILTTIGEVPGPQQNVEYAFVTVDLMCGVLIFATIVGNVGSMISNISAGRTDFQNRIDSIKQYMDLRGVGKQLEVRVIKWFDYLWANKQGLTDAQVLRVLPDKLQAEIAMHVHFETLRKVRIFQDCEAGLLAELVLKLQLQVFSPGDYVCRKGDIGREMYIVKRGMLQVVADDGHKVFATLSEGAVFGELSILNIAGSKNGNRRTANVRSVGYTDLFVLNKNDLWIALREYPEARKILINKGRELLRKDNLLDENAPEEHKTAEELSEELQSSVRILQIRIARLMAEQTNTETKLRARIGYLEGKLRKYTDLTGESLVVPEENDEEEEDERRH